MAWREQAATLPLAQAVPAASNEQPAAGFEPRTVAESIPMLRPLGQVGNTYVIAEGPDGMYLIDQHAAHERVLYERFLSQRSNGAREVQPLLQPQAIELTARQRALLETFGAELEASGLEIEAFGEGAWLLRAVPPALASGDVTRAVPELLDLLGREDGTPTQEPAHRVAASLACHASVRAGQSMTEEEQRELLRLLEASEHARTCPHGRPTMIDVSADTLARQFRRK